MIQCIYCLSEFPWEIITAILTLGLLIVGWFQFDKFNKQVRADFTYKIYNDVLNWLKAHKEADNWVFKSENPITFKEYDEWEIDNLLGYYETVWALIQRDLVDRDLIYSLLSDFVIVPYEANDFALKKIIEQIRAEEKDQNFYKGFEDLYKEMKKIYNQSQRF